jgi:cysteine desulfurase/selenocysteine lyase
MITVNTMQWSRRQFVSLSAIAAGSGWRAGASVMTQASVVSTFPALAQRVNGHDLVYLDSAATTLRPASVIEAISDYYRADNANPSPAHTLSRRAAERLAGARQALARFVNAADAAEIVFVRGTTEGINLVAGTWADANVRTGDEIVLTVAEHASNLLPWTRVARKTGARLRILDVDDEGRPRIDQLRNLLSERTRLFAFSHVSNVLGYVNPAKELCALARQAGARVLIDGAQAAPHRPIDVRDLDCDFYVLSGHKMLGPMATGVVWARRELLEGMPPFHLGSNMAHAVDFEGAEYEHGALKFQAGTPDVAGPIGLAAATQLFDAMGRDTLRRHEHELVEHGLRRLAAIPGLRLIGPRTPADRVPVFTFVIEGKPAGAVAQMLDRQGIAVRAGDMAALPLLRRFGTTEAVRASACVYSTRGDLDKLADALM